MKTYQIIYPSGRTIAYAVLTSEQKYALRTITPESHTISETSAIIIKRALGIVNLEDGELIATRNAVVRMFDEITEFERTAAEMASHDTLDAKTHWKAYDDAMTRMSMITSIIDNEKWNRGLAI